MPDSPQDVRRLAAGACIVAALPAAPIILLTTGSGHLALAACALLPAAVLVLGPRLWPGWGRFGSLILVGPALITMVFPGIFILFVSFFALCSEDNGRRYLTTIGAVLAIGGFALPYLAGSIWAVGRPTRAVWAWPLVLLAALVIGLLVLTLVEGGTHHCET